MKNTDILLWKVSLGVWGHSRNVLSSVSAVQVIFESLGDVILLSIQKAATAILPCIPESVSVLQLFWILKYVYVRRILTHCYSIQLNSLFSRYPVRFSSAALQPILVHSGAPGRAGHSGKLSTAKLLNTQWRIDAGTHRMEERWHLYELGFRWETTHTPWRLAVVYTRSPLKAQQAWRGSLSVRCHYRQPGIHF